MIQSSAKMSEGNEPTVAQEDFMLPRCPFLSLPLELRNRIYDLVFAELQNTSVSVFPDVVKTKPTSSIAPMRLALRSTCRQVAQETSGYWCEKLNIDSVIYYSYGILNSPHDLSSHLEAFALLMEKRWPFVKHIHLSLLMLVSCMPSLELNEKDAVTTKLGKALGILGWPTHLRNVSKLTIDEIWGPKNTFDYTRVVECLSFFLKYSNALKDIRIVYQYGVVRYTERYRIDGSEVKEWYTGEVVHHLSMGKNQYRSLDADAVVLWRESSCADRVHETFDNTEVHIATRNPHSHHPPSIGSKRECLRRDLFECGTIAYALFRCQMEVIWGLSIPGIDIE